MNCGNIFGTLFKCRLYSTYIFPPSSASTHPSERKKNRKKNSIHSFIDVFLSILHWDIWMSHAKLSNLIFLHCLDPSHSYSLSLVSKCRCTVIIYVVQNKTFISSTFSLLDYGLNIQFQMCGAEGELGEPGMVKVTRWWVYSVMTLKIISLVPTFSRSCSIIKVYGNKNLKPPENIPSYLPDPYRLLVNYFVQGLSFYGWKFYATSTHTVIHCSLYVNSLLQKRHFAH